MKYQIHASNIKGLGATKVVISLISGLSNNNNLRNCIIYAPKTMNLDFNSKHRGTVSILQTWLPNSIYRFIELKFSTWIFKNRPTMVLGDIPLRGIKNQIVLVHQPNLIKPEINKYSSKDLKYRILRYLFEKNLKYSKIVIVQTEIMARDLIKSYPQIRSVIKIITHPGPEFEGINYEERKIKKKLGHKLILFYPSAAYPHKKHDFLKDLEEFMNLESISEPIFEIWLTLNEEEYKPYKNISFIKNLGRLTLKEIHNTYKEVDAMLFLSSLESLGLPLLEAMNYNLPIITPKLDYALWILENKGYYFRDYSCSEFLKTLEIVKNDLVNFKAIDYKNEKLKFSKTWDEVAAEYYSLLATK